MEGKLSFRTTLLTTFWILLLLALLLPSWFYYRNITRAVAIEAEKNAVRELRLVHWLLTNEKQIRDADLLQTWIKALAEQMDVRITVVTHEGRVIADSAFSLSEVAEMENFSTRPEIVQAQSEDVGILVRYSRIVDKEFIFAAKKVEAVGWIPSGYLRLAVQFSSVKDVLSRLKETFLLLLVVIFAAAALLSYALARRLRSPVHLLTDAIQAIGNRDYKKRIRFGPSQELYPLAQSVNQMAEKLERQFLGISGEKQRLEAVFDGMQEGVMVLDSRGRIQSINRALTEMAGRPANPVGKRPMELIMSLDLQETCDRMLSSPEAARAIPEKLQIELGDSRTYDITMVKFGDAKGGMGAILVFHDISELKRLELVRQDFVANVSHELRTPLASIKESTELLLAAGEPDRDALSSSLPIIRRNADHMAKTVDDLLQLAQLETGRTPIKKSTLNASDSLKTAWRACVSLADAKSVALVNELPEEGIPVYADFDQIVQLFRNLLENSIRYSPQRSSIRVESHIEGDTVRFSIKDDGPGIPKHYQQRVFERFFRLERHKGSELDATGLGLAICRHIVKNHGGKIWVQSPNPGEATGSTFHFTLQKANPDNESAWQSPA